jgi:glycosyltransferase involved in cell wall biosynthesis
VAILFAYNHPDRFIELDREILAQKWEIRDWHQPKRTANFPQLVKQVMGCELVVGWFASWHTFFPILLAYLLKKPSLLIIGGYDLANLPHIGYGHQRTGVKKWMSRWTMRMADRLVTNSHFSQREAEVNAAIPSERVQVLYHGVPDLVGELPGSARKPMALTVGNVEHSNLHRKGHELFVRAAEHLPEMDFVLVGAWRDTAVEHLKEIAPSNVRFTGWIEFGELVDYYRQASVYVQASMHEGFGMSVVEAMLAGCIPVVSRFGALPEVVRLGGFYLDELDPLHLAEQISLAHGASDRVRSDLRKDMLARFPMCQRTEKLHQCIEELLMTHAPPSPTGNLGVNPGQS